MDPKSIDINIHPTKTEIKFENDRAIYAILLAAVKQSLGKYNIAPVLDFEQETSFNVPPLLEGEKVPLPSINIDSKYNPFKTDILSPREKANKEHWEKLFGSTIEQERTAEHLKQLQGDATIKHDADEKMNLSIEAGLESVTHESDVSIHRPFQVHNTYILTQIKSGLIIIHQQYAEERILYEQYLKALESNKSASQKQLFSQTVELSAADFQLFKEIEEDIRELGFEVREFGKNTVVIEGIPADTSLDNAETLLQSLLEQFKNNVSDLKLQKRDNLARSLARNLAIKQGKPLKSEEMVALIDELFACDMPYYSPYGNPTVTVLSLDELGKKFEK